MPCDRRVPKSSISVEEYIPGAAKQSTQISLQDTTELRGKTFGFVAETKETAMSGNVESNILVNI